MDISPKHILTAAVVVLNNNSEILLINGPKRGWEIPAGRVEVGESISSAVVRETKEETGIHIEIINFCGIFQNAENEFKNKGFTTATSSNQDEYVKFRIMIKDTISNENAKELVEGFIGTIENQIPRQVAGDLGLSEFLWGR